jgi:Putative transposase of IS4/5 family (DUF4096)
MIRDAAETTIVCLWKGEGVLWVVRTGAPWRDLPDEFDKWYTVYSAFRARAPFSARGSRRKGRAARRWRWPQRPQNRPAARDPGRRAPPAPKRRATGSPDSTQGPEKIDLPAVGAACDFSLCIALRWGTLRSAYPPYQSVATPRPRPRPGRCAQVRLAPANAGLEFSQGKEPNRRYRLDLAERPDGEASDGHRRGEGASPAQHAVQFPRSPPKPRA